MSKTITIGSLMTAATLLAAYIYQRRRALTGQADNLFDACECALKRFGSDPQEHFAA